MTRDDIRKLIGGYATGSLTEAERKLLFEAALDDQELFDELAHEQSLKELIETPGARDRLIAALDRPKVERAWWKQPWPWAAVAAMSLGIVVLVSIVPHRQSKPEEVALAPEEKPQLLAPAPAASPAANAPAAKQFAKSVSEPAPPKKKTRESFEEKFVETAKEKDTKLRDELSEDLKAKAEARTAPAAPPARVVTGTIDGAPTPPAAQQAATPSARVQQQVLETAQRQDLARAAVAMNQARFSFVYRIEPEGYVNVTVAGEGYLRVETPTPEVMANNLHVLDGSTTRLKIPEGSRELTITFAASPPALDKAGAVGALFGTRKSAGRLSAKKDQDSGVVSDPTPSPNSRLVVTVQLH